MLTYHHYSHRKSRSFYEDLQQKNSTGLQNTEVYLRNNMSYIFINHKGCRKEATNTTLLFWWSRVALLLSVATVLWHGD